MIFICSSLLLVRCGSAVRVVGKRQQQHQKRIEQKTPSELLDRACKAMKAYIVAMQEKKTKKSRSTKSLALGSAEEEEDRSGEDSAEEEDMDEDASEQGAYVLIYRAPKRGGTKLLR